MALRENKIVQREKKMMLMMKVHLRAYKWMPEMNGIGSVPYSITACKRYINEVMTEQLQ
jgi:hypothetical protein